GKYKISADLPGVEKEEINVKADEKHVEISADVNQEVREENEEYVRRERTQRSYRRRVAWPDKVDPETIEAEYDNGVLTISAEKEEDSGKEIDIE
ncbi:MAG: Hsp20/alpha crystallin family protein, partial [Candidatus Nanohaloarchaea archaeon]